MAEVNPEAAIDVFHGVKVVELAEWVFVPVAGSLLADWGADVVKVEHPVRGDAYRGLVSQGILRTISGGINQSVELANRGKRSIGLDVKQPEGRALLLRLLEDADVFLTSHLPGTLRRLEIGVDDLRAVNPNLIYARGHGQGVRGPDADQPAFDISAFWARGGLGETLTPDGMEQPIAQRGAFGDRSAAVHLAFGIAAALYRRRATGEASVVDVSLLASAMWTLGSDVLAALQGNAAAAPTAGRSVRESPNALFNTYRTSDGRSLCLSMVASDKYWREFCQAVGRPGLEHDARFADAGRREEHSRELFDILSTVFRSRTLAEWRTALAEERFPWAPFQRVPEVLDDRQVIANGYLAEVEVPGSSSFRLPTGAVQFDEQPAALRRGPEHGQHTELVLLDLGLSWDEIGQLKETGIIP